MLAIFVMQVAQIRIVKIKFNYANYLDISKLSNVWSSNRTITRLTFFRFTAPMVANLSILLLAEVEPSEIVVFCVAEIFSTFTGVSATSLLVWFGWSLVSSASARYICSLSSSSQSGLICGKRRSIFCQLSQWRKPVTAQ